MYHRVRHWAIHTRGDMVDKIAFEREIFPTYEDDKKTVPREERAQLRERYIKRDFAEANRVATVLQENGVIESVRR